MKKQVLSMGLLLIVPEALAATGSDPLADMQLEEFQPRQTWLFSGFFEARQQQFSSHFNTLSSRVRVQGGVEFQPEQTDSGQWFAKLEVRTERQRLHLEQADSESRINEAYVQYQMGDWTWVAGRQRVTVGMADGRNTFDLINPVDLRDPIATGRNSTRLTSDLISTAWSQGQHSVAVWVMPEAAVNRHAGLTSPWSRGRALDIHSPKQSEALFRYSFFGQGKDVSLLYFSGFSDDPTVNEQGKLEYVRYDAYGLQWAQGLGSSTLRGEIALKQGIPVQTAHGYTKTQLQQIILGWDRNLDAGRYFNMQLFYDSYKDFSAFDQFGMTYAMSEKYWQDSLTVGWRGSWEWRRSQVTSELYLHYQHNDQWQWKAGRYWIDGEKGAALNRFHKNALFYLQVTYQF